jgi:hypothetical protein
MFVCSIIVLVSFVGSRTKLTRYHARLVASGRYLKSVPLLAKLSDKERNVLGGALLERTIKAGRFSHACGCCQSLLALPLLSNTHALTIFSFLT